MLYRREGFPQEDSLVLCTVTKILPHAIFVNLDEYDKGGLVHISEVAPGRIRNIREYVEIGKKIVCKALRIDSERGHIDLSLRRVSEMDRKRKLEEIKQEQKAEKVIEIVSKEMDRKFNDVYEIVTSKVFEHYPFVYAFFKEVAVGEARIEEFISDAMLAKALGDEVKDRFKPQSVTIKGVFDLKSFASEGVEQIKNALIEGRKEGQKTGNIRIIYAGGGRYNLTVGAPTYKEAERTIKAVEEAVVGSLGDEGEASFAREES